MLRFIKFNLLFICVCFLLVNCVGSNQPIKKSSFYTLEYPPPEISAASPLPYTLRVERFSISPEYDTDRLVYREKKFARNNYNYHKWRSNPRDLVTHTLTRDLIRSQLFKAVFSYQSLFPTAYTISGSVDEFYENDQEPWTAVLSVNIVLLKENEPDSDKKVLFQKHYSTEKPCAEKSPQALVEAMGNAMSHVSKEIISDIYQHLYDSE